MVDAPERIWAYETPDGDTGWLDDPTHGQVTGSTEYIRADIAASQLAEKEAEQQAKDKEYWSILEQCANLETELAEARADGKASYKMAYDAGVQWKLRAEAAEAERDRLAANNARKDADNARLREALGPFADIAGEAWADKNGWTVAACQNDRIRDWFGPSDFFAARTALAGKE